MSLSSSLNILRKELLLRTQSDIENQCKQNGISIKGSKIEMIDKLIESLSEEKKSNTSNQDIINQLLTLNIANRNEIENALTKVVNKFDMNEVVSYLQKQKEQTSTITTTTTTSHSYGIKSTDKWDDNDDIKSDPIILPPSKDKDNKNKNKNKNKINENLKIFASYQWSPFLPKPYPQKIEHELIIDFWVRINKLFSHNQGIAAILILLITNYSVPSFKFRFGDDKLIGIYNDGSLCHQLLKKQCSILFGPRIKYDGIDKNTIYTFKFKMISGNISIGLCSNDFTKWNKLLHDLNDLRHSIIWKNGYYHYNKNGENNRNSINSHHIDDIFEDNDIVKLEIDLIKLKCFVSNLTNYKFRRNKVELPIQDLVKYSGSTGYLQIVIGFFDDFGDRSWVKGAGKIEVVEQRGTYYQQKV